MNNKNDRISLAEWIANLRASLDEAVRHRKEMEALNGASVLKLAVQEIILEATVETERAEGFGPKVSFWIAELTADQKTTRNATQKVTIKLKPDFLHLAGATPPTAEERTFLPTKNEDPR